MSFDETRAARYAAPSRGPVLPTFYGDPVDPPTVRLPVTRPARDATGAYRQSATDGESPTATDHSQADGKHRKDSSSGLGSIGSIIRDIGLVTFGKYGQYVITLVTVPLLARMLGPHGTGLLAIGMSSYFIGSLVVDLGVTSFLAAKVPEHDPGHLEVNRLRGTYLAIRATTLTLIGVALLASLAIGVSPKLHMVLLGLFAGGFWSISEDWLLIGQGRFGSSTMYQGVGRIGYLGLLVGLLPRFPSASMAVLCLLVSSIATVALTWWDSFRKFGPPARPYGVRAVLRMAAPIFTSRLLVTGYGQGSAAVYGAVLEAASLGLYSAGDRLVRAIQSTLDPIGFALLPRMARRSAHDQFWRNQIQMLIGCVTLACLAMVSVWVLAPILIHLIYTHDFDGAIPLLRVEILILPATTITSYVTTAVLPVKQDTIGVLIGAIIGTCVAAVALVVAARTGSVWTLVYGTVSAEISVALWYIVRVRWLMVRERAGHGGPVEPATALLTKGDLA
ncbi:lipopolysaccharide biosynthesis protein [Nocardia sp. NPDC059091]|uniref:lipopolysaccharide biosynthesis protein n=1 Tax=unclassified Nocardia TaxID=2637762 RepID=UPI0036C28DA4